MTTLVAPLAVVAINATISASSPPTLGGNITASPVPGGNMTTFAPSGLVNEKLEDLFTLVGSAISIVAILFTLVMYLHYKHLHSPANHLFMTVLLVDLFAALSYFSCVFFATEEQRRSQLHCNACGFLEQVYSMAEPCLMTVFWFNIYLLCNGYRMSATCCGRRRALQPMIVATVLAVSVGTATVALANDMFESDGQAWCWISSDHTWFRVAFCWAWVVIGFVVMLVALVRPLCSSNLLDQQKKLLLRRGLLVLAWFLINIVNIISRYLGDEVWLSFQALVNPLTGCLNVLAFLYSERMLTIRALGLPPGAQPNYGFTAAMQFIPDKLREGDTLL